MKRNNLQQSIFLFLGYSSKILPIKRSQETWPSIRILNTSLLFSLAAAATNFHGIKLAQTTYNFPSYFVVYFSKMVPMKRSHLKIEGQNLSVKIILMPGSLAGALAYEEAGLAGTLLCRTLAGLSRDQQALCRRQPDATWTALQGLRMAHNECQLQFRSQRWNCSTLSPRGLAGLAGNPQGAALMRAVLSTTAIPISKSVSPGFRESAFAHAIAAAGVTHAISRACARGQLLDCGCDHSEVSDSGRLSWVGARALGPLGASSGTSSGTSSSPPGAATFPAARWKWSGCSHNVYFGGDFAKAFLDGRRPAADIQARVEQHNGRAGRLAVKNNMQVRCKCHGVSGSCELRTCWRAAPDFRLVGTALKERFQGAVLVDQSNLGGGHPLLRERGANRANRRPPNRPYRQRPKRRPRPRRRPARDLSLDLLYLQRSPNFCDRDASVGFPGTAGRRYFCRYKTTVLG
ncbi:protein Wnt-10b-like [Thrips palmi]|uniref:Protein Wnt n=1 Tax=Thrips palmi TaxID=161013 RepID=A0A6P8YKD8_THRPL|nr:protein Wnt-10b-like [Thrips palmi]